MLQQTTKVTRETLSVGDLHLGLPLDLFDRERLAETAIRKDLPTALDLFAGAGGLSLGFKAAGFRVIGACELDEWACDTIRHNFPDEDVLSGNILSLPNEEFLERFKGVDVIIGGPPCQGFSIANTAGRRADDPRNTLFREYIRIVKLLAPQIVLIENVAGLLTKKTSTGTLYIDIIQDEIEQLGYEVKVKILHAQDYGVPQIRPRLVIIGSKNRLAAFHPAPTHSSAADDQLGFFSNAALHIPLWAAISDLPIIKAREGSEEMYYSSDPSNDLQRLLRAGANTLFNHKAMMHSARLVNRFAQVPWGGSGADVKGEFAARKRNGAGEGKRFDQNNRRNFPMRPSHTIPASFYANFIHPFEDRNYTPREGARIQTFPDWYRFMGKPTVVSQKLLSREGRKGEMHLCQYNQIGNAVPPILSYHIARNLKEQI
ncbi:DNA cytosine methyltransferase [uncultured Cohaesibacter sp.]|uniref:DNA cytosine methyltransferase n=1 Tax=uncultured Cohaesibacter sp. TaxID=1002546 RepID=UPI0029C7B189|nr:DNA cytosine methyltransferase [uncultured Cohaesibacter sp.]